jgi:hypothetical protein
MSETVLAGTCPTTPPGNLKKRTTYLCVCVCVCVCVCISSISMYKNDVGAMCSHSKKIFYFFCFISFMITKTPLTPPFPP